MILSDVITEARKLLQDTNVDASLQRYSDTTLLGFANQTLKRIALVRPDLFSYVGNITCTAGEVLQAAPTDSIRLMEVFRVSGGSAIRETNRNTIDQTYPGWVDATAASCVNWMRHPRNPNKFFIYPKAPAGQVLIGEYAKAPSSYTSSQTVELLPDAYFTTVIDGTVFLAESIDNEHVTNGRAKMFYDSFSSSLESNYKTRLFTDLDSGGLDKRDLP
jgi:hypothetical protein